MRRSVTLLLLFGVALSLPAQYSRSRSTTARGGRATATAGSASKDEPLPTFKGQFHSSAGGKLYLDTGDENQMEFWLNRKTVVLQGDKKIKLDDLKQGTLISVEAKLVVATRMDAVTIRVETGKEQPKQN